MLVQASHAPLPDFDALKRPTALAVSMRRRCTGTAAHHPKNLDGEVPAPVAFMYVRHRNVTRQHE